jgi:hypothetical protein
MDTRVVDFGVPGQRADHANAWDAAGQRGSSEAGGSQGEAKRELLTSEAGCAG